MHNFRIVLLSIAAFAVLAATSDNNLQAQAVGTLAPMQTAPATVTQPQQIRAPSFIPLAVDHVAYVDKVLSYWQQRTEKVHLYRTKFQRWQFDTVYGPANTFKTFSTGKIQYAEPDKGLFKVEEVLSYHAAVSAAAKPSYKAIPGVHGEYWVCDGKSIFEYDYNNQKLIQQILPAELKGKNIINGPLPFLFGANADDIKRRFWVRAITSPTAKKEIWLEAYPKSAQDASNYQRIHIIISTEDFLPKGLVIFDRSYVKGKNHSRTVFSFQDRDVNFASTLNKLNPFYRNFYEPSLPSGWQKVVHAAPTARPTTRQATQNPNTPR
ncbi:MAG: TIGR03009 domain-containing protein [Planctomycetota bacterium]|nr:TIGR03009 domain-containing protein [Planctomycetota bacterium]